VRPTRTVRIAPTLTETSSPEAGEPISAWCVVGRWVDIGSVERDDELAAGLACVNESMGFGDLLEREDASWFGVEHASLGLLDELLEGHVGDREVLVAERERAGEGAQLNAAREVEQGVEVRDRLESAEEPDLDDASFRPRARIRLCRLPAASPSSSSR
jgi:hypothetical protein